MSIAIVKIDNHHLITFKKVVSAFNGKIRVFNNQEQQEKQIMLKLIEESDDSETVPEAEVKKYFRKNGINV